MSENNERQCCYVSTRTRKQCTNIIKRFPDRNMCSYHHIRVNQSITPQFCTYVSNKTGEQC